MTGTPAPVLDLVAAKMYELERDNEELLGMQMTVQDDGWHVAISTDAGTRIFHLDVWGSRLEVVKDPVAA